ncbi:hypothetical protein [Arthrobacter oryzae]|uniref:Uncharacterized protein n=1 Tax=Arthrobacter oryzae TaxID=409290 RepID=A0A3N0C7Y7_9MICC|nr:hypothetical protein [Arthrobacter oryzae]RNL58974.1 hypothetical protein D7003_03035 [Arthrobacter oryzae]
MPSNPLFLKSASISVSGVEYADLITNVVFTPTTPTLTHKGISGKVATSVGATEWSVTFDYAQSFDTAGSLALRLFNDEGKKVPAIFKPEGAASAATITATVTLLPGTMGGAVDAAATSSVTLPIDGKPTIVPASA